MKTAYMLPALICILFYELVLKENIESDSSYECLIEISIKSPKKRINNVIYPCVESDYSNRTDDTIKNNIHLSEEC